MAKLINSVNALFYYTVFFISHYFSSLAFLQVLTTFSSKRPVDYQTQTKFKTLVLSQSFPGVCCLLFKIEKEAFVPVSFPSFFQNMSLYQKKLVLPTSWSALWLVEHGGFTRAVASAMERLCLPEETAWLSCHRRQMSEEDLSFLIRPKTVTQAEMQEGAGN